MILRDREGHVKVNGRVRRDHGFPVGIMGKLFSVMKNNRYPYHRKNWRKL
jgi:ribosomal protein S4E